MVVHRTEFEDVDALVVEAEPLLAEQHRPRTVELDRERDQPHHRQCQHQDREADDVVEQPLHHQVPIGDRRLEHVERRHLAEIGIGAGTETQLVGMGRKPDIDRQHPQLLQHLENAGLGRDRQREQHEVDAGAARQFDDVVHLAELGAAGAGIHRAVVVAVVEHPEHLDVGIVLDLERPHQIFAVLVRAHDDGTAIELALTGPAAHQRAQKQPTGHQRCKAREEKRREPEPGDFAAELDDEGCADEQQKHERPGRDQPGHLSQMSAEQLHLVEIGGLEADHGRRGHGDDRREELPGKAAERDDISEIQRDADRGEDHEVDDANHTRDHDRRIGAADFLVADGNGGRRKPAAAFERRVTGGGGHRGRRRGVEHRACVNRFHLSMSVLEAST